MDGAIAGVLEELEAQASLERSGEADVRPEEKMLAITKDAGELLNMILRIKGARSMLEIGTSVGYSTIWCAEALGDSGRIVTIEQDPNKIRRARGNFERAGISDMVTIMEGRALDVLSGMGRRGWTGEGPTRFDAVLIDADKEGVMEYFDLVLPMVPVGGVIVTDNMLYPEKYREHMGRFADSLRANPAVRTITSPIGYGEEITIRLS